MKFGWIETEHIIYCHFLYYLELDLIPLVVTLVSCLWIGLEYGILIGLAVNIVFVLYSSARPKISIERNKLSCGDTFVVTPTRSLQYPSAEFVREKIIKECDLFNSTVIIHGRYVRSVDATVAKVCKQKIISNKLCNNVEKYKYKMNK